MLTYTTVENVTEFLPELVELPEGEEGIRLIEMAEADVDRPSTPPWRRTKKPGGSSTLKNSDRCKPNAST